MNLNLTIAILFVAVIYLLIKNISLSHNIKQEQEHNKLKQSFLANLVHDLKTPTNAQLSTLQMLNNEIFGRLNSEQREMISLTHDSCKYMSDLIETIMETYTHDNGVVHLHKNDFDIVNLINSINKELKNLSTRNHQTIEFHKSCATCIIHADKLQIKRVLSNLLTNAITYGLENTTITVTLKTQNNNIEINIKNISK